MPRKTPEVPVSPAVLKWARETAGYPEEDVARRIGVAAGRVQDWEKAVEQAYLTVGQLEELAQFYKRPLAALLLLKPPEEPRLPQDFRRPLKREAPLSPDLRLAIRRAHRLQRLARDVMDALGLPSTSNIPQASHHEDPEEVARAQRAAFGIAVREQLKWRDPREAFRRWRDALEQRCVLVFQGDFPRDEAQGFSVSETHPYAIVATWRDHPTARCFSLFHEYAHLLLREGGICLTEEMPPPDNNNLARTESWCHRFAEAFLVDREALSERRETLPVVRQEPGYEQELRRLAWSFKVSQPVVLFRLWHAGFITQERFWAEYDRLRSAMQADAEQHKAEKEKKGGMSPARRVTQERGRFFTRLVLEGLDREILGYTEVMDYLGVRLEHLEKVRQATYG